VHGPETCEYDTAPEPEPPTATRGIEDPKLIELEDAIVRVSWFAWSISAVGDPDTVTE
jgi:hypothetical protein